MDAIIYEQLFLNRISGIVFDAGYKTGLLLCKPFAGLIVVVAFVNSVNRVPVWRKFAEQTVIAGGRICKPNHLGYGFVHINYRMHLDASFSLTICGCPAYTLHNILKKADGGAVKYFYLLVDHFLNPAVRDKVLIFFEQTPVDISKKISRPSFVGIRKGTSIRNMFQFEMLCFARQPKHSSGYLTQGTTLRKHTKHHADQVVFR